MSILLGPFDPIRIQFNTLNSLMAKGVLSLDEVKTILREALDPKLSNEEKEQILNSLFTQSNA